MLCPECQIKAFTKETRTRTGNVVQRRYQCPMCHRRFTTEETLKTTTAEGRDAFGRFLPKNGLMHPKLHANCCGGCNHWLHDGCALKLRTPSRARRFSAGCDDWLLRYGPEAPPPIGRKGRDLKPKQPTVEQVMPKEPQPQPENFKSICRKCAFSWGGKCDLGLPKPAKRPCGSFLSVREDAEAEEAMA